MKSAFKVDDVVSVYEDNKAFALKQNALDVQNAHAIGLSAVHTMGLRLDKVLSPESIAQANKLATTMLNTIPDEVVAFDVISAACARVAAACATNMIIGTTGNHPQLAPVYFASFLGLMTQEFTALTLGALVNPNAPVVQGEVAGVERVN